MKKIFSLLLVCCTAFVFADDAPVFEESNEYMNVKAEGYVPFAADEPIFEDDDDDDDGRPRNACKDCGDRNHSKEGDENPMLPLMLPYMHKGTHRDSPCYDEGEENQLQASYVSWKRYRTNFGMEKLFIRFPQKPAVSQSNILLTAYAYDYGVLYSLSGYFPPVSHINPSIWFDEVLCVLDHHPYTLISHAIFQVSNGDWVMDYVSHDYVQNLIIKARAILTPFNGYTLQCVKPNGSRDYFDYFLDNFYIRCECD